MVHKAAYFHESVRLILFYLISASSVVSVGDIPSRVFCVLIQTTPDFMCGMHVVRMMRQQVLCMQTSPYLVEWAPIFSSGDPFSAVTVGIA